VKHLTVAVAVAAMTASAIAGAAPTAAAWHTPEWWRRHWELSGLLEGIARGPGFPPSGLPRRLPAG